MVSDQLTEMLVREIQSLRREVQEIKQLLGGGTPNCAPKSSLHLQFTFAKIGSGRLPYEMRVTGNVTKTYKLSEVRTALLLVLLMDCKDSAAGGVGVNDRVEKASLITARLQGKHPSRKSMEMAIGRLRETDFFGEPSLTAARIECKYVKNDFRLLLRDATDDRHLPVKIDITCDDPTLQACLNNELTISQLERVRQQHISHVQGGPTGFDQLFLEFFDHSYRVHETSMFFKPSIISYPDNLLEVLRASEQDRRRKDIMYRDLERDRCSFLEILHRSTLDEMIRSGEHGGFRLYGAEVEQHLVLAHFANLIHQVERMKGFKLVLTDAPLPFLLSTFQITMPNHQENFTVFFRQLIREHDHDIDCIAIYDESITHSILDNVVGRVLRDPSTTTDRQLVKKELEEKARHLRQHGPLPY